MRLIKAPHFFSNKLNNKVFLAGSIEMGAAVNWRDKLASLLQNEDVTLLNPRRDDWDSSWKQSIDDPQFREQVEWELEGLEEADVVAIVFDPNTKSPITLLELGLVAALRDPDKIFVYCPGGFWRKGNVDIVCRRYGIQVCESLEQLSKCIVRRLEGDPQDR